MWLVTKYGFYSVVAHRDDPDVMLVRGRCRDDLETLRGFGQGRGIRMPEIVTTDGSDYCCRLFMPRRDWEQLGAALTVEIDYDNFKQQVHGDPLRDAAYMQMWSTMRRFQEQKLDPDAYAPVRPAWTEPGWDYSQPSLADYYLDGFDDGDSEDFYDDDDEPDEADVFDFLDTLRDSGVTNMYGARPYLEETFGFEKKEAAEWLARWMQTYAGRHGLGEE